MKRVYFVCLFQCLATIFLLSQSNSVPLINQGARVLAPISASQTDPKAQAWILDTYGKLPLTFEANHGQTDERVKFLSRAGGYMLFLTGDEAVLALPETSTDKAKMASTAHTLQSGIAAPKAGAVLRMKLLDANPTVKITGADELASTSNYFIGNDPAKWHSDVPTYAKVKYEGIYSGIDLVYYGNQRQLEYDFIVAPGADPRRIAFHVRGAKRIRQDGHGDLVLKTETGEGEIRWHKPVVYQEKDGTRQKLAAHYVIKHKNRVGFEIAEYDLRRPLFIDPLVYSTYLGGGGDDLGWGIAVDGAGNAYVTGYTTSTNFPTKNPLQPDHAVGGSNGYDAFVAKLNPAGSALVYSTYLGGSGDDYGSGIAVDSAGNAYVSGTTFSTDFPTKNPFQPANAGFANVFLTKINPAGSALVYSTYLGGSGGDEGFSIAVDGAGNAYLTGLTLSDDFPTMNPLQPARGGDSDAFVTKINPAGSALVYSTYLGGGQDEYGFGVAADTAGNAYVTGQTFSINFPTMNPLQPLYGGGDGNAFVTKINATGSALVYSTFLGGSDRDLGNGIAIDTAGNAYVTGEAHSFDFPTTPGAFRTVCNGGSGDCASNGDAFVAKINTTGSPLVYSTFLGGSGGDNGYGIAVDSAGNAYVAGGTDSADFPVTPGAFQTVCDVSGNGCGSAFVTQLNTTGSALVYSTYLGDSDVSLGIAVDSECHAYVTGFTQSTAFPTKRPFQAANAGGSDAFVTKFQHHHCHLRRQFR
jgi:hypothetical protein